MPRKTMFLFQHKKRVKFGVMVPARSEEFLTSLYSCQAQLAINIEMKSSIKKIYFYSYAELSKKSNTAGISNKQKKQDTVKNAILFLLEFS